MNMEIKFRGKRINDGQWVYGYLLSRSAIGKWGNSEYYSYCEVIPETVSQYTNLKDKNGKEIYEGDIINYGKYSDKSPCNFVVEFDKSHAQYSSKELRQNKYSEGKFSGLDPYGKVVGNIHDNKKLLIL